MAITVDDINKILDTEMLAAAPKSTTPAPTTLSELYAADNAAKAAKAELQAQKKAAAKEMKKSGAKVPLAKATEFNANLTLNKLGAAQVSQASMKVKANTALTPTPWSSIDLKFQAPAEGSAFAEVKKQILTDLDNATAEALKAQLTAQGWAKAKPIEPNFIYVDNSITKLHTGTSPQTPDSNGLTVTDKENIIASTVELMQNMTHKLNKLQQAKLNTLGGDYIILEKLSPLSPSSESPKTPAAPKICPHSKAPKKS